MYGGEACSCVCGCSKSSTGTLAGALMRCLPNTSSSFPLSGAGLVAADGLGMDSWRFISGSLVLRVLARSKKCRWPPSCGPGCWLAIASTPEGAAAADVDELNVDKAMVDAAALALAWCTSCCSDAWLGMWPIRSDLWLWRRGSRVLEGVQGEVSLNSPSVTATASCEWHGMPEGLIKNTSALLAYKFSLLVNVTWTRHPADSLQSNFSCR
mmetsp:Transcript_31074/g.92530  ORF Transcript_31074/g.92530 Transcript_31074/m.92530 type:complete len:211 (-) Transcript_31074:616-1248(-)